MKEFLRKIGFKVRDSVQSWTKSEPSIKKNMQGACAIASFALLRILRKLGMKPSLVVGKITGGCFHAWIEIDGWIVDLTFSQFRKEKVYIAKEKHWVHKNPLLQNEDAEFFVLGDWGKQSPRKYFKQIKQLERTI